MKLTYAILGLCLIITNVFISCDQKPATYTTKYPANKPNANPSSTTQTEGKNEDPNNSKQILKPREKQNKTNASNSFDSTIVSLTRSLSVVINEVNNNKNELSNLASSFDSLKSLVNEHEKKNTGTNNTKLLDIVFWMALVILLLLAYRYLWILKEEVKHNKKLLFEKLNVLDEIRSSLYHRTEVLNTKYRELEKEIRLSRMIHIPANINNEKEEFKPQEFTIDYRDKKNISTKGTSQKLYLPGPRPEGIFNAESAETYLKQSESIYEFTISDEDPNRASFVFVQDDSAMIRAINSRDTFITPACDSDIAFDTKYSRIRTISPGEAVLENNLWRVIRKAMVHYE